METGRCRGWSWCVHSTYSLESCWVTLVVSVVSSTVIAPVAVQYGPDIASLVTPLCLPRMQSRP